MQAVIQSIIDHKALIITVLFFLSEILALVPSVKANSVFQLLFSFVSKEKAAQDALPPSA